MTLCNFVEVSKNKYVNDQKYLRWELNSLDEFGIDLIIFFCLGEGTILILIEQNMHNELKTHIYIYILTNKKST